MSAAVTLFSIRFCSVRSYFIIHTLPLETYSTIPLVACEDETNRLVVDFSLACRLFVLWTVCNVDGFDLHAHIVGSDDTGCLYVSFVVYIL